MGGDAAGEREEIAVAERGRPLLRRHQQILSPGRPLQPAFAAQGLDDVVCGFVATAQQPDDLRSRRLAPPQFGKRQHDLAFLR